MTYFPNKMLLGKNVNKIKSEHIEAEGRLYLECCYYVYVSVSYDGFQKKRNHLEWKDNLSNGTIQHICSHLLLSVAGCL